MAVNLATGNGSTSFFVHHNGICGEFVRLVGNRGYGLNSRCRAGGIGSRCHRSRHVYGPSAMRTQYALITVDSILTSSHDPSHVRAFARGFGPSIIVRIYQSDQLSPKLSPESASEPSHEDSRKPQHSNV